MTAAEVPNDQHPPTAPARAAGAAGPGLLSRLSDRLNPILVREVQQAIKGKVFPLTIMIALAVSVVIAAVVASDPESGSSGRRAFDAGFATLVPLLVFVVPMQAYNSMRTELKGGIVEQLLMSRLSPGRVLFGKLQAAMVQFLLYVSILSPLLATSYLLRGVDLLTVAISLLFALIVCVAATAFAVSSAAQAVVPALQPIANLGIAFGLGIATFGLVAMIASGGYASGLGALLRSREFAAAVSGMIGIAVLATTLSWLAARSYLLHAFENKSTGFRVFLWLLPALVYGWMLTFVESIYWDEAFPVLTVGLMFAGLLFGVFMVTEQREFSPRVRSHVPASSVRALLLTPLLPGRDRGLLCFTMFALFVMAIGLLFWPAASGPYSISRFAGRLGLMAMAYGLVYLGIGRWLRGLLPDTLQASQAGRVVLPVLLFLSMVLPVLVDALTRGEVDEWHIGHVMNPIWTISHFLDSRWPTATPVVVGVLIGGTAIQLPVWLRGAREVARASAAHRERLARGVLPVVVAGPGDEGPRAAAEGGETAADA